jgi:hypothetical protein
MAKQQQKKFGLVIQQKMIAFADDKMDAQDESVLRVEPFNEPEGDLESEVVWVDVKTDAEVETRAKADSIIKKMKKPGTYRVCAVEERVLAEVPKPVFQLS